MNQHLIWCTGLLQLLFISFTAEAQEVRLSSSLHSTNYVIGDWINVHVSVDHPENTLLLWNDASLNDSSVLEKIAESKIDTIQHQGFVTENKIITFISYDSGVLRIPSITLPYQENGISSSISTTPLSIYVAGLAVDTTKSYRPIKPTFAVSVKDNRLLIYGILGVSLVMIAALYWRYRNRSGGMIFKESLLVDNRLPHEKALAALYELETGKLWERNETKQFYFQVTYIIRTYIESALLLPALDHTTSEIISSLKKHLKDNDLLNRLKRDLKMADLVKFAKAQPSVDYHLQIIETAKLLVKETSPSLALPNKDVV
ncbi:MAG: hypothetical protein H0V65_07630 [Chitinophagales bacterium]|nr:hypothetical protein [Chitinophagales bacterium]